jgi:hypothetical protein
MDAHLAVNHELRSGLDARVASAACQSLRCSLQFTTRASG